MSEHVARVSAAARNAVSRKDWRTVYACAQDILSSDGASAEGHFLTGLVLKAENLAEQAAAAFAQALALDNRRYDAAIELAGLYSAARRNGDAAALLRAYEEQVANSPHYLNQAGNVYLEIGMQDRATPLFERANELQPGIPVIENNLATCYMFLGRIDEAREIFQRLLDRDPTHQRNHLTFARLDKAGDRNHIEQMKAILERTQSPPERNIFMYYAIGKELEDLEAWDEAFEYFKMAGDAVTRVANYDIDTDLQLIDKVISVCDADWLDDQPAIATDEAGFKTPIFVIGLPRTGTTLVDRILASHSQVQSVGETQFMQMVIRRESGIESEEKMTPAMIEAAAGLDIDLIGRGYLDMLKYRLGNEPFFVDKLPFNILYAGFIAKAFPQARLVYIKRNPMDACFAMYKQVFTWAYKFSYTLEGLGRFYVAFDRLLRHWKETLGDRLLELEYESLVADQKQQTRRLLDGLGLPFEEACLDFHKNESATATASSIQVREKAHTRSVNRWKHYEQQLQPLRDYLENAGISIE